MPAPPPAGETAPVCTSTVVKPARLAPAANVRLVQLSSDGMPAAFTGASGLPVPATSAPLAANCAATGLAICWSKQTLIFGVPTAFVTAG